MGMIFPYFYANMRGIPRLEADSVNISTTAVTYNFSPHKFINANFSGLILFKLPKYTAPATAVPIVFNTNDKIQELTTYDGAAVTSADLNTAGIRLAYYENGVLQLIS